MQVIYLIDNKPYYTDDISTVDITQVQCMSRVDHPEIIMNMLKDNADPILFHKALHEYLSVYTNLRFSKYIVDLAIKAGRKTVKCVEDIYHAIAYDLFGSSYEAGVIFCKDVNNSIIYNGLRTTNFLNCKYSDIAIINPYGCNVVKYMKLNNYDLSAITCRDDIIKFYNNHGFEIEQLMDKQIYYNHFDYKVYTQNKFYTVKELNDIFDNNAFNDMKIEYFVTSALLSKYSIYDFNNINDCYKPFAFNTLTHQNNHKIYSYMCRCRNNINMYLNTNVNFKIELTKLNGVYIPLSVIGLVIPRNIFIEYNQWHYISYYDRVLQIDILKRFVSILPEWIENDDKNMLNALISCKIVDKHDRILPVHEYIGFYIDDSDLVSNLCYTLLNVYQTSEECYKMLMNKIHPSIIDNNKLVTILCNVEDKFKKIYNKELQLSVHDIATIFKLDFIF